MSKNLSVFQSFPDGSAGRQRDHAQMQDHKDEVHKWKRLAAALDAQDRQAAQLKLWLLQAGCEAPGDRQSPAPNSSPPSSPD
jgi:hypothetical protein